LNPPYGREIAKFMNKANEESKKGITVVCLVPSRTDTNWWWDNVIMHEVRFVKGRLKFGGQGPAPFPSAVVVMK
jgi:site-specific DNA-methyltransferase (adenine-specific)